MTARRLCTGALFEVLDTLAMGYTIREAAGMVGASEGAFWTWKNKSKRALAECSFDSVFYMPNWHGRLGFFHEHVATAQQPPNKVEPEFEPDAVTPIPPGNALTDYLKAQARAHLSDPNRITQPHGIVHVVRDAPDDAARERINQPSDQSGLPTQMADAPRPEPPGRGGSVDYSRKVKTVARVDRGEQIGHGTPPAGGFRVA